MNIKFKMSISCIILSFAAFVQAEQPVKSTENLLVFQVVQAQMMLDSSTVKSASLIQHDDGGYGGLLIELKPAAAEELGKLTSDNMGKTLILSFNNTIISSAQIQSVLGNKIQISGISNLDALNFISTLKKIDPPKEKMPNG